MNEAFQFAGAVLVLIAFVLSQAGTMRLHDYSYLLLNFVGTAVLGASALVTRQWGFVVLDAVFAVVSLTSLFRRALGALRGVTST